MLLSLDNLAKRYGLLPSEALGRATTFDLYVLDVSSKFQNYLQEKSDGKNPKGSMPSQKKMFEMMQNARNMDYDFN
jgi:hypothetical protein